MPRPLTASQRERTRAKLIEQNAKDALPDALFPQRFDPVTMSAEMRDIIAKGGPKLFKELLRSLHRGCRRDDKSARQQVGELLGVLRTGGVNFNLNQQFNATEAPPASAFASRFDSIVNRRSEARLQLPAPSAALPTNEQSVLEAVPVEDERA